MLIEYFSAFCRRTFASTPLMVSRHLCVCRLKRWANCHFTGLFSMLPARQLENISRRTKPVRRNASFALCASALWVGKLVPFCRIQLSEVRADGGEWISDGFVRDLFNIGILARLMLNDGKLLGDFTVNCNNLLINQLVIIGKLILLPT